MMTEEQIQACKGVIQGHAAEVIDGASIVRIAEECRALLESMGADNAALAAYAFAIGEAIHDSRHGADNFVREALTLVAARKEAE